ncbi:MAG: BamA/TamA family outer membrane protein, partial [Bacteroidota bacterium]
IVQFIFIRPADDSYFNTLTGFSFYFDRSFTTEASKEVWIRAAEELQASLTDEVIEGAVRHWPKEIFELHGEEVIKKLKSRRKYLRQNAIDHYAFLSKYVNVVGSNKHEHFKVDRLENGDVHVVVRKMQKDGDKKQVIYDRLFKYGETKEIRLFGLEGNDEFKIKGETGKSIKVRVIGGPDKDELDDDSKVTGPGKKTVFYDTKEGNKLKLNGESKNKLSTKPGVNNYDRKAFKYDVLAPLVTANINPDDGLFLGGGFIFTSHGFRKAPFRSRHLFLGSYAINTASYNFKYNGDFVEAIGNWDLNIGVDVKQPNFVNNFFGLGNESEFDTDIDDRINVSSAIRYYRVRYQDIAATLGVSRKIGQHGQLSLAYNFRSVEVERPDSDERRFISDEFVVDRPDLDVFGSYRSFSGGTVGLTFDKRNSKALTTAGVLWDNTFSYTAGIKDSDASFGSVNSELSFYYTFRLPSKLTVATRFGWGANIGDDYEFYQSQILGGVEQLRGFRRTRFYGDSKAYNNLELRLKLFSLRTYIFPASFGLLAFNDIGRVWLDGEDSDTWHHGVGGGIWFAPFNMAVISTEIGASSEETQFYLRLGFLF